MASSGAELEDSSYVKVQGDVAMTHQYIQYINILKKEVGTLQKRIRRNENTEAKMRDLLVKAKLEKVELVQERTLLKDTCEQNKQMAKELIGELDKANAELHDNELEINSLKTELKRAATDLDALKTEMENYAEIKKEQDSVKDAKANEAMEEELRQAHAEVKELKETMNLLGATLAKRDEELKKLTDQINASVANIKQDIESVDKKVENGMNAMMNKMASMEEMMKQLAAFKDNRKGKNKDGDDSNEDEKNTKKSKKQKDKMKAPWRPGKR